MKARHTALALAATAALLLSGCAGTTVSDSGSGDAGATKELKSVPGFDAETKTITLGSLVPTSGAFAQAVTNITGQEAWFHRATQPGGPLEGFTVNVKNYDTEYNASVAVPLYSSMKNDVLMLSNVLGVSIVNALLPQMATDKMLAVPAVAPIDLLQNENLVPYGPVYGVFHASGIEYLAKEEGLKDAKFCALLQDDDFGDQVEEGFNYTTKALGLATGSAIRFPVTQQDFTAQVSKLKDDGCGVIDLAGTGTALQQAATRAVQLGLDAKWIVGNTSYHPTLADGPAADYIKENVRFIMAGTEWGDDSAEGQKMMEEDLEAIDPSYVPFANSYQTGYMTGITTTAVLKKAIDDGDLSRENLIRVAKSLGTVEDYGLAGGPYEYGDSPADRKSGYKLSIFTIDSSTATGLKLKKFAYDSSVAQKFNNEEVNK